MARGTPLEGDHAAFDDLSYASKHSKGVKGSTPTIHNPWPAAAGQAPVSDGSKYVATEVLTGDALSSHANDPDAHILHEPYIMTIFTYEGELALAQSHLRIYNQYGTNRRIVKVFISVDTAPAGDDIIVDISMDAASIFLSSAEMPAIFATENTGYSVTFENDIWQIDSYLLFEIINIGSSTPGSYLTIQVVHEAYDGPVGYS
jgi:hypothetical protein